MTKIAISGIDLDTNEQIIIHWDDAVETLPQAIAASKAKRSLDPRKAL